MQENNLEQIVTFPTWGENTLDLFLTNHPSPVLRCKPLPGISDHDAILTLAQTSAVRSKPVARKILLWKNADTVSIQTAATQFSEDFISRYNASTEIDSLWGTFRDFVSKTIQSYIPSKLTSTRYSQPWITRKAKRLSRRKKRAFKQARSSKSPSDLEYYHKLKKDTRHECRRAYNSYVNDMVTTDRNPKKLYSLVKDKKSDSNGVAPLKSDGLSHSEASAKASILNRQFTSVFTDEDRSTMPTLGDSPHPDMHHFTITASGVAKLLRDLDLHKACGPDNIPTKFLRDYAEELVPPLALLFQASIDQGEVPMDWRQAHVTRAVDCQATHESVRFTNRGWRITNRFANHRIIQGCQNAPSPVAIAVYIEHGDGYIFQGNKNKKKNSKIEKKVNKLSVFHPSIRRPETDLNNPPPTDANTKSS